MWLKRACAAERTGERIGNNENENDGTGDGDGDGDGDGQTRMTNDG